jgi:hypothetical protein
MNPTIIFSVKSISHPQSYDAIEINAHNETTNEVITSKKLINEALLKNQNISYNVALHLVEGGIETVWVSMKEEEALAIAYEISTTYENLSNISVNIEKTEEDTTFVMVYCYYSEEEEDQEKETFVDARSKEEFEELHLTALELYFDNHDTKEEPYAVWVE